MKFCYHKLCFSWGVAEIIDDGINGKLYPAGNYQKPAESMMDLLINHEVIKRVARQAKMTAVQKYTIEIFTQRINQIIEQVLA
jgi:glycosyltransferase involved in cell wall biosynthesis